MSHFAKVEDGIVTAVISAEQDFIDSGAVGDPSSWIQTSYNSRLNVHYLPNSDTPSGKPALRGNYAGKGYIYDKDNDVFYPPRPFPSWNLNTETWGWEPPIPYPMDGKFYSWNEDILNWEAYTPV